MLNLDIMQIYTSVETAQIASPSVLTIGNFDGVHLGHQALLHTVTDVARSLALPDAATALVTFEPHPLKVLRPQLQLDLLTTPLERMQLAAGLGIGIGVIQPFTTELASLDAREFLALLKQHLNMAALVVGPDFALGRNRSGDIATLATLSESLDYRLLVQEHITARDRSVRSRTIRKCLAEGDVGEAAALLGRSYHVAGLVAAGDQRGRQFGVPTANLDVPDDKMWPADGVYVTRTWIMDEAAPQARPSVTNIGFQPTVHGTTRRLETHLLDFPAGSESGNLYGTVLIVEFVERLRGEQRFTGPEELVKQIHTDIEAARRRLAELPAPEEPFFMLSPAGSVASD